MVATSSISQKQIFDQKSRTFQFSPDNIKKANRYIQQYPYNRKRSAVMPLLYLAQSQNNNWISISAMDYIAKLLGMPSIQVYEIANFYTLFNTKPVGKYLIQICRTTPCMLRGAKYITDICKKNLQINLGDTTTDNQFTLVEVECLGACTNAPLVQINNDYYENITPTYIKNLLDKLSKK